MAAPITEFRQRIAQVLRDEFTAEGLSVLDDRLDESLGTDGDIAAVYPEAEAPGEGMVDQVFLIGVQVFMRYDLQVDPRQRVDPAKIEGWAHRFQRALRGNSSPGTQNAWWFNLARLDYPNDPTGNKTRFVAMLEGHGPSASLAETQP